MPVLKIKKNGVWEEVAGFSEHAHEISDITDFPSSLPADGGNADTLDGKHADEFALASDIPEAYIHPENHSADMITGLANVAVSGDYNDLANQPSIPSIEGLATVEYVDEKVAAIGDGSGGSGNGGVSSWNDLTDKPFYEEEGVATIMAEQDITEFANNQGYGVPSRGFNFGEDMDAFTLEPGVEYTVMWDGNSYPVQLQDISAMMGAEAYALGNAAAFDPSFSGNNEPFLIGWNIVGIVILVVDGSTKTTHKVGISQYGQIVKTLDVKYLPMEAIDERIEAYLSTALEGDY